MSDDPRAELPVPNRRPPGAGRPRPPAPRPVVEPSVVYEPPPPRHPHGDPAVRKDLGLVLFVAVALVLGVVTWNVAGSLAGDLLGPDPATAGVAGATGEPASRPPSSAGPSDGAGASADPSPSGSASPSPIATPSATPRPVRKAVTVRIEDKPAAVFASEQTKTWCAAAAVQIALNSNGPAGKVDTSRDRQAAIRKLQVDLTTRKDSKNGGAGPLGMVASLERLGKVDYELRIYKTRAEALRAAAAAISRTGHAAILLAWRGAHAWVMTGYKADADPTVFKDAVIRGAYIIDPWYPRVSSIWGPSDKPGAYQDAAEMKRNFLPWKRPEGKYPGRDGRFLVIVPTS